MAEASPIALDGLQPDDELLQSALWGRFKERFGWRAQPLQWKAAGDGGTLLALTRSTPLGPLVYVPGGPPRAPAAPAAAGRMLEDLAPAITLQGWLGAGPRVPRPTVVRYDLPWPVAERRRSTVPGTGGRAADQHRAGATPER